MSFTQIRSLVAGGQALIAQAQSVSAAQVRPLWQEARALLAEADALAERSKVGVVHGEHGYGVLLGVSRNGLAEVTFGGEPFAVAVPLESLTEDVL